MLDINAILETAGGIYQTTTPDGHQTFSYRLLSMKEYRVFAALRDGGILPPHELFTQVFDRCHLGSFVPDATRAGMIPSVGQWILWLSGDCESQTLKQDIDHLRELHPADSVNAYQMSIITSVFPYKLKEIEAWPRTEFHRQFVIAENILAKQNPDFERFNTSQILSPEQVEKLKQKQNPANIDFAAENMSIRKGMGAGNVEDMETEMGQKRARVKALTRAQAAKMDRIRRGG
jgi:hypothetical protein